jgi:ADP-ribose pyrophosphatase YjhB (NUDIX family)
MNDWLKWITTLQALSQNGLTYAEDPFDVERYEAIHQISTEMLTNISSLSHKEILELFVQEKGYATPKMDVRAGVIKEGKILMVREKSDGLWSLPGGWADVNLSPSESIEKEIREESGYIAKARKLVALYDLRKHSHPTHFYHIYKSLFLCDLEGGEPQINIEISAIDFFAPDDLPPLSLPRVVPSQIAKLFEHYANPDLPTEFD